MRKRASERVLQLNFVEGRTSLGWEGITLMNFFQKRLLLVKRERELVL